MTDEQQLYSAGLAAANRADDNERDASRYRWLRAKSHSLESQHGDGNSCYHTVGGVRELKSGYELDGAVDAAIAQSAKNAEAIKQLMLFYSVDSLQDLALIQAKHVERLQSKLPPMLVEQPGRVREG